MVWSKSNSELRNLNLFLVLKMFYDICFLCILVFGLKLVLIFFLGLIEMDEGYRGVFFGLVFLAFSIELYRCIFFRIFRILIK